MKTQFGELVTADLHEGTLTIEVGETIIAQAGKYAVMPIEVYEKLVNGVDERTKAANEDSGLHLQRVSNNEVAVCPYCKEPASINNKCVNIACVNWLNKC